MDHNHQLNREVAPEEIKDLDRVSECLHIHPRMPASSQQPRIQKNRVSDRSRSPQGQEEGSRRQGPQTLERKNNTAEKQPSELPRAKKHKSMDSDEHDEEPQNEPGTSSNSQPFLYQYDIIIKDQEQVRKDQQPVRKDQLQVLLLVMKTVSIVMNFVHKVRTPKGHCS